MGENAQTGHTHQIYEKTTTVRVYKVCGAHYRSYNFVRGPTSRRVRKEIFSSDNMGRIRQLDQHIDHNLAGRNAFL